MAKKMYVGVSNKAKNIKTGYIGVEGKARKIKKVYVGVGGKAKLVWESTQYILTAPAQSGSLTYSGSAQTPSWNSNYLTSYMTLSVTAQTNAGTYSATFTPKAGYGWTDGTTAAKSVSWSIGKKSITIPTVSNTSFTYNKSSQGPTVTNNSSTYITTTGASATAAGSYSITFTLKSTANTKWSDGTTAAKSTSWSIAKRKLTKPTLTNTSYTYDGGSKAPTINNYDSGYMTKSGTESSSTAGSYTITFKLSDTTNTTWSDNTTSNVSCSWSIAKKSITIPTVTNTSFTYNGNAKSPTITNNNSTYITTGGTTSATDASSSYSITFTLKDTTNTQWSDGTTAQKSVGWKINKANQSVTLSPTSYTFPDTTTTNATKTVSISGTIVGTLSASGGSTSTIATSISGTTLTLTRKTSSAVSSRTITVTAASTTNYNSASATITVAATAYDPTSYELVLPAQSGSLTFNTSNQTPSWDSDYESGKMTLSVTAQTSAGTYTATFTPRSGYGWTDGTTAAKTAYWSIGKRSITIPTVSGSPTYTGNSLSATITNLNTTYVSVTGNTSTNAGDKTVTMSLIYPGDTTWTDGTTGNKTGSWKINKATYATPRLDSYSCSFSSSDSEGSEWSTGCSNYYVSELSDYGYSSAINVSLSAGTDKIYITRVHTSTFSTSVKIYKPGDDNHYASDDAVINVSGSYYNPISYTLTRPTSNSTTYDGSSHSINGYDINRMTFTGDEEAVLGTTEAGTYTATVYPDGGYGWSDGGSEGVEVTLYIAKAPQSVRFGNLGGFTNESACGEQIWVDVYSEGSIYDFGADGDDVSVMISGSTFIVERRSELQFEVTCYVKVSGTSNYLPGEGRFTIYADTFVPELSIGCTQSSISLSSQHTNEVITFYAHDSSYTGGFEIYVGSYIGYEIEHDDGNSIAIRVVKNYTGTGWSYISVSPADSYYTGWASCEIYVS